MASQPREGMINHLCYHNQANQETPKTNDEQESFAAMTKEEE